MTMVNKCVDVYHLKCSSEAFEILHLALVFFCRFQRIKSTEVPALFSLGIYFHGIETVFPGYQFSDHEYALFNS